jgi:hypothetical protein
MAQRVTGKDIFYVVLAGGAAFALFKVFAGSAVLQQGLRRFWDGMTFDPASLGPSAALTQGAQLSQQDYIERGYLEIDPATGWSRITPAGEEYIRQQQAAATMGGYVRDVNGERVQ